MKLSLRTILETNLSLKIISLVLGIGFWLIYGANHVSSVHLTIPLCYYSASEKKDAAGPETLAVEIAGKRTDLYNLDLDALGLHINLDDLEYGEQLIEISPEKLFLPNQLKLVHCNPLNPVITVVEKQALVA